MGERESATLREGRYVATRLLGEGGQAATFEGVDKQRGKPVVLKRFRVRGAKSWKEVELAEREAKVLASLDHPLLPEYVDHFEENGELWLVTEKVEGESLANLRATGSSFGEEDVLRFLRDASEMLDYLHGRAPPVIHRDIKPSNVLRRADGRYSLIDFGAVRDRMKAEGGSTVVGTFGYMAPEQFQGRAMPQTDVYAVAATALVLLTGVEPEDLPHKGLAIDVASALRARPVGGKLARALEAMLSPDPDQRAKRIAPLLAAIDAPEPAWRRSPRAERHEQRRVRKEEKRRERSERREARALRRADAWQAMSRGPGFWVPFPIVLLFRLGLVVAEVAVGVALQVVVPLVLTTLSIVFGRGLRDAANQVFRSGAYARSRIDAAARGLRRHHEGSAPEDLRIRVTGDVDDVPKRVEVREPLVEEEEDLDPPRPRARSQR